MAKTKADLISVIHSNLEFTTANPITPSESDVDDAIDSAVAWYSRDRPQEKVTTLTGNGTNRYTLPDDWDTAFSHVIYIEYPVSETSPSLLDPGELIVWNNGTSETFQFTLRTFATSETINVRYTTPHILTDDTNTISDADFDAMGFLGTALSAWKAAGRGISGAGISSPGGGGILGGLRTMSDMYATYAKDMFKHYYRLMRIDPKVGSPPALILGDADITPGWGFSWLTHGSR